ncbi:CLUMA_CG011783, isoform A [Clunio marinus]|uniref:CLUMA_CG011783, isoform A n=1 Tax=Clunio marinus TaxID=568069 RepID=A0A1J1IIZ9_9DIPT|nr:CLUMA_CG011783, isoform A [Clunio marinus]
MESKEVKYFLDNYENIIKSLSENSTKLKDLSQYESVRESLKALVSNILKTSVEIHFFGSRVIGLATEESDLDIFVEVDESFHKTFTKTNEFLDQFKKISSALDKSSEWTVKESDLITTNGFSTRSSQLVRHLFTSQPEAVSLFHFIKKWINLNEFYGFSGYTYTIVLLLIFFLQSKNFMPSIETIQQNLPKEFIQSWEVQFDPNLNLNAYKTTKISDYKKHIHEFFKFYSEFDYSQVMSVYDGLIYEENKYKKIHPNFLLNGINIGGPTNRGKNYGVVDEIQKNRFVTLCGYSSLSLFEKFLENKIK